MLSHRTQNWTWSQTPSAHKNRPLTCAQWTARHLRYDSVHLHYYHQHIHHSSCRPLKGRMPGDQIWHHHRDWRRPAFLQGWVSNSTTHQAILWQNKTYLHTWWWSAHVDQSADLTDITGGCQPRTTVGLVARSPCLRGGQLCQPSLTLPLRTSWPRKYTSFQVPKFRCFFSYIHTYITHTWVKNFFYYNLYIVIVSQALGSGCILGRVYWDPAS